MTHSQTLPYRQRRRAQLACVPVLVLGSLLGWSHGGEARDASQLLSELTPQDPTAVVDPAPWVGSDVYLEVVLTGSVQVASGIHGLSIDTNVPEWLLPRTLYGGMSTSESVVANKRAKLHGRVIGFDAASGKAGQGVAVDWRRITLIDPAAAAEETKNSQEIILGPQLRTVELACQSPGNAIGDLERDYSGRVVHWIVTVASFRSTKGGIVTTREFSRQNSGGRHLLTSFAVPVNTQLGTDSMAEGKTLEISGTLKGFGLASMGRGQKASHPVLDIIQVAQPREAAAREAEAPINVLPRQFTQELCDQAIALDELNRRYQGRRVAWTVRFEKVLPPVEKGGCQLLGVNEARLFGHNPTWLFVWSLPVTRDMPEDRLRGLRIGAHQVIFSGTIAAIEEDPREITQGDRRIRIRTARFETESLEIHDR